VSVPLPGFFLLAEAPGDVPRMLGILAAVLLAAKLLGELTERLGQPAVVGELIAGVLLGPSLFGLVDPGDPFLHLLAEAGVVILLFSIGLETDLGRLLKVGATSATVALVGVVLPFAGGFAAARLLGIAHGPSIVIGAALTATSVGITARVLSDLGCLDKDESQVILGAAVIDDVVGLVILAIVAEAFNGEQVTATVVLRSAVLAFGFVAAAVVLGGWLARPLFALVDRWAKSEAVASTGLALALLFAWLAFVAHSAPIVGAFAAGLIIAPTAQKKAVEDGIRHVGSFFVPIFFVSVGAAVRVLDYLSVRTMVIGLVLLVIGIAGKVAAGYAPWWFRGHKLLVGVGMVPRGEVGLIFATVGLQLQVLDQQLFSALAFVVFVTTIFAPPVLKRLQSQLEGPRRPSAIADLVSDI
jgi:Kef-type K+ transport system membrane component KefB